MGDDKGHLQRALRRRLYAGPEPGYPVAMFAFDAARYPASPGVYLMKDARGGIIYVGKAKSLRARLGSYFRGDAAHTPKTAALVGRVAAVDVLMTSSEKEALLLEASLIKKHRPRFNIILRDDKQYILFKLDRRGDFPRLTFTRRVERDGAAYFGPFVSASAARRTWKELHRLFPLRTCPDRAMRNRVRPCLYHHIGQCLAPCVKNVSPQAYGEHVRKLEAFLSGRSAEVLRSLDREMRAAAGELRFEQAAELRDHIRAMKETVEGQTVVLGNLRDLDVAAVAATPRGLGLCVLFVRQGRLLDKATFNWPGRGQDEAAEALLAGLAQFYRPEGFIPARVIVPVELLAPAPDGPEHEPGQASDRESAADHLAALAEALCERRGAPVVVSPPRGREERGLVNLAEANAARAVDEAAGVGERGGPDLGRALRLGREIRRVETADVSHLSGQGTRVGLVVFEDGRPAPRQNRAYAVPEAEGSSDDYLALSLFLSRRLDSGPPWPDLLLIDGGRGQLSAVKAALDAAVAEGRVEEGLFELAAIAKSGRRGRAETADQVFRPGRANPLPLRPGGPELLYLQRMRDAAHDFAIGRQRRARRKAALSSALDGLPGVGPHTARLLLAAFGSVAGLTAASEEDLRRVPGIGPAKARALRAALARRDVAGDPA